MTTTDTDALRLALAMVRADWQDDEDGWDQLWAVTEDPGRARPGADPAVP